MENRKKSLKGKVIIVMVLVMVFFVACSSILGYSAYHYIVNQNPDITIKLSGTEFFWYLFGIESAFGAVLVIICISLFQIYIIHPLASLNDALADADARGEKGQIDFERIRESLAELNLNSDSEIGLLYDTLLDHTYMASEYMHSMEEDTWAEEHDSMTMLANRVQYEKLKEEIYKHAESVYMASMDIVNMKIMNEKISVEAGDSIISKVAREMRRLDCETIHTYRLENDHFLIVLYDYTEGEAKAVMNKWLKRVGRLNRSSDPFECRLVCGGAFGENVFNVDDVYDRALEAMLEEKKNYKEQYA